MTPAEIVLRRRLLDKGLPSSEWDKFSAAIKNRAFFSANIASAKFLDEARSAVADMLQQGGGSRAEAVSRIMQAARQEGLSQDAASLRDPGSVARANVIVSTNAGMAAGYVKAQLSNTYGARLAFPAQELVRIEEREKPRNWQVKWQGAGGRLFSGRMIALKEDPIWIRISRFGNPYPPFDFNSGMGVEDVSLDEAVSLGVIEEGYQPPEASPIESFNASLEADLQLQDSAVIELLKRTFGDRVKLENGILKWIEPALNHD